MNPDLDSLQKQLHNQLGLPTIKDFNLCNLMVLCYAYGTCLLQKTEEDQQIYSANNRLKTMPEMKCDQSCMISQFDRSELFESVQGLYNSKELTLNWPEIYELLDNAFSDRQDEGKGCQLLETLDYHVKVTPQMTKKIIYWLQQTNRFKDQQIRSIYYRLLNLSFEDSKDQTTFPGFVTLIHTEIQSIFDMRNNYIRTIEELNGQITDLIAQSTKKQIEKSCYRGIREVVSEEHPSKEQNYVFSDGRRQTLMEQRRSLERSVEDMLSELLTLKAENEQLRGRLFERDQQINSLRRNDDSETKEVGRQDIYAKVRQELQQLNKNIAQAFRPLKSLSSKEVYSSKDLLTVLTNLNCQLQSTKINDNTNALNSQIKSIVKVLDKLVVSEGKQGKDMETIQDLFILVRTLQTSIMSELQAELVGPKIMSCIARLLKVISKADKKLHKSLEIERGFLLQLLGQLVPTHRTYDTLPTEIRSHTLQSEIKQLQQMNERLKQQLKQCKQSHDNLQKTKQQLARTVVEASKHIKQLEKDISEITKSNLDLQSQNKKIKQKENIKDELTRKEAEIQNLKKQIKQLNTQLETQRKFNNEEKNKLIEQIHETGMRLEDIQRLAEKKLHCPDRKVERQSLNLRKRIL